MAKPSDSAHNAAVLAWCLWAKEQSDTAAPENRAEAVRVAVEAARPFIEAPLRARIERLERELLEERARTSAMRESFLSALIVQGETVQ